MLLILKLYTVNPGHVKDASRCSGCFESEYEIGFGGKSSDEIRENSFVNSMVFLSQNYWLP